MTTRFERGQAIWFRPQQGGGYGFARDIPGVVLRYTRARIVIRVERAFGEAIEIAVAPANVRPREQAAP